jgi:pimeloyl-ACP methyl ester carboxylesterase
MNEERKPSSKVLHNIAAGAGVAAATGLAAAAGWAAYSALFIDHRKQLRPAIDAKRYVTATPLAGRLSFYADESAAGDPLLLLHSINAAASAYEMRPIFDYFRGKRPVFALDLPGFGSSERGDRNYSPDLYVQAILDFVDGELAGRVDVAALSLSCEFTALAALEQPDFFRSLVMIAPTGFDDRSRKTSHAAVIRRYRAAAFPLWGQAVYDAMVSRPSIDYFLQKAFAGPVDPQFAEYSYLTSHRPGARYAPLHFISGGLWTQNIDEVYSSLTVPVLAFCDPSTYATSTRLPEFARERINWEFECMPEASAMPHWVRPEATCAAIERFVAR